MWPEGGAAARTRKRHDHDQLALGAGQDRIRGDDHGRSGLTRLPGTSGTKRNQPDLPPARLGRLT